MGFDFVTGGGKWAVKPLLGSQLKNKETEIVFDL